MHRTALAFWLLALSVVAGCAAPAAPGGPSESSPPADSSPTPALSNPTTSTLPAASPKPTGVAELSTPPELVVSPPADMLPAGAVARVTVDALRVRETALGEEGGDRIVTVLSAGDLVLVPFDPFAYLPPETSPDGRGWYAVHVGGRDALSYVDGGLNGWVAEGESGLEYLVSETAPCPGPDPDVESLLAFSGPGSSEADMRFEAWDRLACYGDQAIALKGMIDLVCQHGPIYPFSLQPVWLAHGPGCIGLGAEDPNAQGFRIDRLPLSLRPGVYDEWQRGDLVQLTGHFDDPAAADCHVEAPTDFPGPVPDPQFLVMFCRGQFVVDSVTVNGHLDLPPQY